MADGKQLPLLGNRMWSVAALCFAARSSTHHVRRGLGKGAREEVLSIQKEMAARHLIHSGVAPFGLVVA
jgi:hypothetical protein